MASCEEEAQKARRPVVLSINKLAKGSSHHGPVQLGTGRRIKIVGTPLSKLSLHHRPFRASSSSFTIFESSPLWLPRNQRAPSGLSFADLRSLLSFSLHRFLFFSFSLFKRPLSRGFPPSPSIFRTQNLCLRTTLTLEKREIGNCRFTQSLREEPAYSKGNTYMRFRSYPLLWRRRVVAKVSDWKFKIVLVGSGVVNRGDRSCKI